MKDGTGSMAAIAHTAPAGHRPSRPISRPTKTRWLALCCASMLPALVQAETLLALHEGHSAPAWTHTALAATSAAADLPLTIATPLVTMTPLVLATQASTLMTGGSTTAVIPVDRSHFPAPGLAKPAWATGTSTAPIAPASRPWHSARLVEIPRDVTPGQQQQYHRPRYALGFQSHGLKSLLANAGMDPHSCLAPIVRLRTKVSNGGDVSGTFWLYARCSFR